MYILVRANNITNYSRFTYTWKKRMHGLPAKRNIIATSSPSHTSNIDIYLPSDLAMKVAFCSLSSAVPVLIFFWSMSLVGIASGFSIPTVKLFASRRSIISTDLHQAAGKKEFVSISSDGTKNIARSTGSLGKPSKKKKQKIAKQQSKKLSKQERQRTANGTIDSNGNIANSMDPAQQGLQVVRGNRGSKTVTIIRGMNATSIEEKKKILKLLKRKLGVGGTLVDGVLEIQGSDKIDTVVDTLRGIGYAKARKVGK